MKINNTELNPAQNSRTDSAKPIDKNTVAGRKGKYAAKINNKDEAAVSNMARILAKTHQALQETPDVRTEIVDSTRQKILDGTYEVPIEELAKKLLKRF